MFMSFRYVRIFSAVTGLVLVVATAGCSHDEPEAFALPDHPRFTRVVDVADLGPAIGATERPVTLLVPAEAALAAARKDRPGLFSDPALAAYLVKLHLLEGRFTRADLLARRGTRIRTLAGTSVMLGGTGAVLRVDGVTVRGAVRSPGGPPGLALDGVLLPPPAIGGG